MPPSYGIWAENLCRKMGWMWVKTFFFWSSPKFGQKNGLILSEDHFFLIFIILKFPGPLLLKILRTLVLKSLNF